jgi:hypothetical protein
MSHKDEIKAALLEAGMDEAYDYIKELETDVDLLTLMIEVIEKLVDTRDNENTR